MGSFRGTFAWLILLCLMLYCAVAKGGLLYDSQIMGLESPPETEELFQHVCGKYFERPVVGLKPDNLLNYVVTTTPETFSVSEELNGNRGREMCLNVASSLHFDHVEEVRKDVAWTVQKDKTMTITLDVTECVMAYQNLHVRIGITNGPIIQYENQHLRGFFLFTVDYPFIGAELDMSFCHPFDFVLWNVNNKKILAFEKIISKILPNSSLDQLYSRYLSKIDASRKYSFNVNSKLEHYLEFMQPNDKDENRTDSKKRNGKMKAKDEIHISRKKGIGSNERELVYPSYSGSNISNNPKNIFPENSGESSDHLNPPDERIRTKSQITDIPSSGSNKARRSTSHEATNIHRFGSRNDTKRDIKEDSSYSVGKSSGPQEESSSSETQASSVRVKSQVHTSQRESKLLPSVQPKVHATPSHSGNKITNDNAKKVIPPTRQSREKSNKNRKPYCLSRSSSLMSANTAYFTASSGDSDSSLASDEGNLYKGEQRIARSWDKDDSPSISPSYTNGKPPAPVEKSVSKNKGTNRYRIEERKLTISSGSSSSSQDVPEREPAIESTYNEQSTYDTYSISSHTELGESSWPHSIEQSSTEEESYSPKISTYPSTRTASMASNKPQYEASISTSESSGRPARRNAYSDTEDTFEKGSFYSTDNPRQSVNQRGEKGRYHSSRRNLSFENQMRLANHRDSFRGHYSSGQSRRPSMNQREKSEHYSSEQNRRPSISQLQKSEHYSSEQNRRPSISQLEKSEHYYSRENGRPSISQREKSEHYRGRQPSLENQRQSKGRSSRGNSSTYFSFSDDAWESDIDANRNYGKTKKIRLVGVLKSALAIALRVVISKCYKYDRKLVT